LNIIYNDGEFLTVWVINPEALSVEKQSHYLQKIIEQAPEIRVLEGDSPFILFSFTYDQKTHYDIPTPYMGFNGITRAQATHDVLVQGIQTEKGLLLTNTDLNSQDLLKIFNMIKGKSCENK